MKKIALLLIAALVLGLGSMDAQTTNKKFKKSTVGTAKTEVKTEKKVEKKAEDKTSGSFKKVDATTSDKASAAKKAVTATNKNLTEKQATTTSSAKKQAHAKAPAVHASSVDKSNLNGFFTNTYSDGIGGTCTHRLTVEYDEATGTVTGLHTNESGVARTYHGKVVGDKVVCYYDEDGDEFAEMKLYDANTIKLEGFTGTFKRDNGETNISASPSGYSGAAAVDRGNYEAIKQYLKEKEEDEKKGK